MSELPSLAELSLGAPTGPYAGDGAARADGYFSDELREDFKDLVTTAMELDETLRGERDRQIKAQKPRCSKYSSFPYPQFDRAMAGYYDNSTEEDRRWVVGTVLRFWENYLHPIMIGEQYEVSSELRKSANKMEIMRTLVVNEWIPALKGYIADRERDLEDPMRLVRALMW